MNITEANIGRLAHAASTFTRERKSNITKADFARKSPQGCARKTLNQVIESLANHSGYKPSEILKAAAILAEQLEAA